jgi:hypothetical protein
MAEYIPIFKPGQAITLKASASITGKQVVAVSGSGTVAPAGAASTAFVGVAGFDAATNDNVTIYAGGVQEVHRFRRDHRWISRHLRRCWDGRGLRHPARRPAGRRRPDHCR